jgi:hypothetical protein
VLHAPTLLKRLCCVGVWWKWSPHCNCSDQRCDPNRSMILDRFQRLDQDSHLPMLAKVEINCYRGYCIGNLWWKNCSEKSKTSNLFWTQENFMWIEPQTYVMNCRRRSIVVCNGYIENVCLRFWSVHESMSCSVTQMCWHTAPNPMPSLNSGHHDSFWTAILNHPPIV